MDGIDQLRLGEGVSGPAQGGHDVGHGLAVVLPAVAGDEYHFSVDIIQIIQCVLRKGKILYNCCLECVNDGVACEEDALCDVFPGQVVTIGRGGAEMEVGDGPHHLPVHLLRVGGPLVVGAQACLHVSDRNPVVEGGQRPGEGGGGVPVDQHQVGLCVLQHPVHAGQALRGDGGQGLTGLHNVQIIVRLQGKDVQHRVQHLPVLGGDTADRFKLRAAGQLQGQGGHFDGLRPGSKDGHNLDFTHRDAPFFWLRRPGAGRTKRYCRRCGPDTVFRPHRPRRTGPAGTAWPARLRWW